MSAFDAGRCSALLETERFGRSLVAHAETGSTMDDARAAADEGAPEGHVVIADHQHRGRGSHGRVWSSPRGGDLYFSLVLRPTLSLSDLPPLTLAVGLGVADTLSSALPSAQVRIKWPNDVFVDGRKCAGILVETRSVGHEPAAVIVGIGVNVNRREFEPALADESTSLALAGGHAVDREALLARLLLDLERRVQSFALGGAAHVASAVDARLLYRGERVRVDELCGTLVGVDADGALRVRDDAGVTRRLLSGRLRADAA